MEGELPIYWVNPMKDEFEVIVETCTPTEEHFEITVDSDCIRPSGGGQAGDQGWLIQGLEKVRILDTVSKDDKTILVVESPVVEKKKFTLRIDMDWRLSMMRNHTGEHLLAGLLVKSIKGLKLGYIWIDGEHGTVEFIGTELADSLILLAERDIQKFIAAGLAVSTVMVSSIDASSEVRAREGISDKHELLRTVQIEGVDASACSGTHVMNTSDIGFFKIIDVKRNDDGTRIEFVTGNRAITLVSDIYNHALVRKKTYPFEMEQLGSVLDKGKEALEIKKQLQETVQLLISEGLSIEEIGSIHFRHHLLAGLDSDNLRNIVKKLKSNRPSAVLLFTPGEKCNLVFWTNNLKEDAGAYIGEIVSSLGGRGGGSKSVYTGGFTDIVDQYALYDNLVSELRNRLSE